MGKRYRIAAAALAAIYFLAYAWTYEQWHFIDNVNLIFHEAGHAIFLLVPVDFVRIAAGSAFQILLPLGIAGYFFFTRQRLSAAICLMWVGQNMLNVSTYAADAIAMKLPLLGGDNVIHDWNYLLDSLGMLAQTPAVAGALYVVGIAVIATGTALAFKFAWEGSTSAPPRDIAGNR